MTPEETKALIDEAQHQLGLTRTTGNMWPELLRDHEVMARLVSALSSHPDEETEWGVMVAGSCPRVVRWGNNRQAIEGALSKEADGATLVHRRPAGPWLPVPADGEGA